MMIDIKRNGQIETIKENTVLKQALEQWDYQGASFAVAINCIFVPRCDFESTYLKEGDDVEIVTPMQGG
ncbi:sulfur carrier protein ThiS [Piscirickettsia litoralis]|uniref:Thiamine biosynthesis protein ThiS n=1 Tax=Piscirickettsia litoralis TaxID=1891921 RepID=A0ABX2ZZ52_9GAMM|nr:sulfur carrier protein ThiS [Piscirickettsia litoralis]ODN41803.1 thiamine biosynthesis protein ThiS [Piscirickettsia litoralis]